MRSKLPPCKVCSKADSAKYACPVDGAPYCSVACFKKHKESGCFTTAKYEPPPAPVLPRVEERRDDDDRPRKRLTDLHWPAEPDPTLWADPLQRDDVKPLRHFELEAIATSHEIRALLASPSDVRNTLSRLLQLPHHARPASLRVLLGLPAEPTPNTYRPESGRRFATGLVPPGQQERDNFGGKEGGRGGRGGRGGARGGRGGGRAGEYGPRILQSTEEERKDVEKFAARVLGILQEAREKKGE